MILIFNHGSWILIIILLLLLLLLPLPSFILNTPHEPWRIQWDLIAFGWWNGTPPKLIVCLLIPILYAAYMEKIWGYCLKFLISLNWTLWLTYVCSIPDTVGISKKMHSSDRSQHTTCNYWGISLSDFECRRSWSQGGPGYSNLYCCAWPWPYACEIFSCVYGPDRVQRPHCDDFFLG